MESQTDIVVIKIQVERILTVLEGLKEAINSYAQDHDSLIKLQVEVERLQKDIGVCFERVRLKEGTQGQSNIIKYLLEFMKILVIAFVLMATGKALKVF